MNKAVKYSAIGVLSLVGVAHIGLLGYVFRGQPDRIQVQQLKYNEAIILILQDQSR